MYGTLWEVQSNNGTHFKGNGVTAWAEEITRIHHIPHHPEASGLVERINYLLYEQIKLLIGRPEMEEEIKRSSSCTQSTRTCKQKVPNGTTGKSPSFADLKSVQNSPRNLSPTLGNSMGQTSMPLQSLYWGEDSYHNGGHWHPETHRDSLVLWLPKPI